MLRGMFGNVLCAMGVVGSFWQFQCLQVKGVCAFQTCISQRPVCCFFGSFTAFPACLPPSCARPLQISIR